MDNQKLIDQEIACQEMSWLFTRDVCWKQFLFECWHSKICLGRNVCTNTACTVIVDWWRSLLFNPWPYSATYFYILNLPTCYSLYICSLVFFTFEFQPQLQALLESKWEWQHCGTSVWLVGVCLSRHCESWPIE